MFKFSPIPLLTVVCGLVVGPNALGQSASEPGKFTPRSSSSSRASDQELRSIYRQDIGQGFSSSSLNQIALSNARAKVGYYGQSSYGQPQSTPSSLGASRTPSLAPSGTKPFSGVTSSPTVSPYLNLFRTDLEGGGDFNYQTLVRPQLQQMATNQQFQRQNMELAQRVQAISAQSPYQNPAGSETIYPTGHQTAFGYYGTYYPGMQQLQQRRNR